MNASDSINKQHVIRTTYYRSVMVLLLLIACSICAVSQDASTPASTIRIGVIGDQTFSKDIQASYGVLQQGVTVLSAQPVDVVLHTGDLVESSLSPSEVTALFTQATGILDRLRAPWFLTAGDHDVNPPVFQQDSPDRSRE